jgi:hypothetical protein
MKALSLFYPTVLPYVLGCPNPMLDQAILYAAGEFCRNTHAVQDVNTQHIVADVSDYCVDVPTASQLTSVIGVWHGSTKLAPVGTDQVWPGTAIRGAVGDFEPDVGTPTTFYQKLPSDPTISLWPVPDVAMENGLAIRAAYEPSSTATSLDDVLYSTYATEVAFGAISYLMLLPGQAFSNPLLGMTFEKRFSSSIEQAKLTAKFGRMMRSARVRNRAFA